MIDKVERTLKRFRMISFGDKVLVGVSGGIDSVVLIDVLFKLKDKLGIQLAVAHFNHELRQTAQRDEEFVEKLAEKYGCPLFKGREDVRKLVKKRGMGIEEAARFARYAFFERVASQENFNKVALAHTLSDNVETFFLRVIKGASVDGLKGIPPVRGIYIRPLIEVSRKEIERYAKENHLYFVQDESNEDERFLRNWIRLKLIPLLEERNPSLEETVGRIQQALREVWEYLDGKVEKLSKDIVKTEGEAIYFNIERLNDIPKALVKRLLFKILYENFYAGTPELLSSSHMEAIMAMLGDSRGSKRIDLPKGVEAVREYSTLSLRRKEAEKKQEGEVLITSCGVYLFGNKLFVIRKGTFPNVVGLGKWCALFDAAKVSFPLVLRHRRPGDRIFIPRVGHKKLQDFFVDLKIPRSKRNSIPILATSEGDVLWVVGYRQREDLKPEGKEALLIEVRGTNENSYNRGTDKS